MLLGYLIDLIIGDPQGWPHIVRAYGKLIAWLEKRFYPLKNKLLGGFLLVFCTLAVVGAVFTLVIAIAARWPAVLILADAILSWQCLATRSLAAETRKVYNALESNDIEKARSAVSMVVGRDTENLDEKGIARAAVETVAENTSDGICAPMFYLTLGGPLGGCIYKAVNTMDSMIGYKNERYEHFGTCAAKLDDILNYLPSRLTALVMILASAIGGFDAKNAFKIWKRDRRRHASPNSAQTESTMAGALGLRLAGDATYGGVLHKKEYIGDANREIQKEDILHSHKIMFLTSALFLVLCELIRIVIYGTFRPWW